MPEVEENVECLNLDPMELFCKIFVDPSTRCNCLSIVPFWCHSDAENCHLLACSKVEETKMHMVSQEYKLLA